MQNSDVFAKFPIPFAEAAGADFIRSIPTASQIGVIAGAASLHDGFVPLNATPLGSGGIPPDIKDMNGILYEISGWSRWLQAGGPVYFDAAFCTAIEGYPAGAVIMSATTIGTLWVNSTENNTTNPDAGGAGWTALLPMPATLSDLITGADTVKYVSAATLAGLRASTAQILAGVDAARYITPAAFYGARAAAADIIAGADDHKYLTAAGLAAAVVDSETTVLPGGLLMKIRAVPIPIGSNVANAPFTWITPFPSAMLFCGGNSDHQSGARSQLSVNMLYQSRFGATVNADTGLPSAPITNAGNVLVLAIGR